MTKEKKSTFLEVAGELVGVVESETEETLLIREARFNFTLEGNQNIILLPGAVFIDKALIDNYWVRLVVASESSVSVTVNLDNSRDFIRKFFNV